MTSFLEANPLLGSQQHMLKVYWALMTALGSIFCTHCQSSQLHRAATALMELATAPTLALQWYAVAMHARQFILVLSLLLPCCLQILLARTAQQQARQHQLAEHA